MKMIAPSRKKRIYDALKAAYFSAPDDVVEVSDGDADDLYVRVVSPKLAALRPLQRNDLVWDILMNRLSPDDWGQISLTVAKSPDEVQAAADQRRYQQ